MSKSVKRKDLTEVHHRSVSSGKYYCLKCMRPNAVCTAHNKFKFIYSPKLRVPTNAKKRAAFRKFLDDCPIFVNCVAEDQREMFLDLLRYVKYFKKSINGQSWTNIKK